MNRAIVILAIGLFLLAAVTEAIIQSFNDRATTAKFYAMGLSNGAAAEAPAETAH